MSTLRVSLNLMVRICFKVTEISTVKIEVRYGLILVFVSAIGQDSLV